MDAGICHTRNDGKGDNAQHVVDDRSSQNGISRTVLSFPSSFRVSTVMLTEVAVSMTPINIFCKKRLPPASDSIIPGRLKSMDDGISA